MKLGVAVSDLSASHLNLLLIKKANTLVGFNPRQDVTVFYEELARPCLPLNFASMQLAEGWAFDGIMIATSFSTAAKIAQFPVCFKKMFYVWDLEWLRFRQKTFRELRQVYGNSELMLIARGPDHAAILQQAWNRDVDIIEDFELTKFLKLCDK